MRTSMEGALLGRKALVRVITLLLLSTLLSGCSLFRRWFADPPNAPPVSTSANLPPVEDSVVLAPITFKGSLTKIEKEIDKLLPFVLGEDDGRFGLEYGVYFPDIRYKGKAVTITGKNNTLESRATLEYRFKLGANPISVSCGYGEPPRQMTVGFDTTIDIDKNWSILSKSNSYTHPENNCSLSIFKSNKTQVIANLVNGKLDQFGKKIDSELPNRTSTLKIKAEEAWKTLQKPIPVVNGVWLLINPSTIEVSKLSINNKDINIALNLAAKPIIRVSTDTPPSSNTLLPHLKIIPNSPIGKFHLALDSFVAYEQASKLADSSYKGRLYPLPSGKQIKIENLRVYGSDSLIIVQVEVSGSLKGTLYLQGTPKYESQTPEGIKDVLTVPNLKYTYETEKFLEKIADWILHDKFEEKLRAAATIPLSIKLEDIRAQAEKALNRDLGDGTRLSGTITKINIAGIYTDSDKFIVRAIGDGSLQLEVGVDN